jgi:hypothetical protein
MPRAIKKVFWRIGLVSKPLISPISIYLTYYLVLHCLNLLDRSFRTIQPPSTYQLPAIVRHQSIAFCNCSNTFWRERSAFSTQQCNFDYRVIRRQLFCLRFISSSRGLADAGLAPRAFAYVDTKGRPLRCFYLSFAFGLLAYLVDLHNENTVFIWLVSLCGLSSIISWTSICATHLR